jgi:hypothetical protein
MVPAIFQNMEEAENSDGFDSCEDFDESKRTESKEIKTRTGNPFQDFHLDLEEV